MKKVYTKNIIYFILVAVLSLYACEDVVEVDLNDEDLNLISVEAYINTYAIHNILVKLEKSLPIDDSDPNPPINNALVQISDDQTLPNTVTLEEFENSGIYILPDNTYYDVIPGRNYELKITTEDGVIITGKEYLQKVEPLDTVRVNLSPLGNYEYLGIYINSQETPGEGHFYKWDIYINNQLLSGSESLTFASDELVDGNYIYDLELYVDWYDEDEEEEQVLKMGDTIMVHQLSISQSVYDFYVGMTNQAHSGNPFSVPPANLANNLTSSDNSKVLGIFSARDISIGNLVIIDSTNFTPMEPSFNE